MTPLITIFCVYAGSILLCAALLDLHDYLECTAWRYDAEDPVPKEVAEITMWVPIFQWITVYLLLSDIVWTIRRKWKVRIAKKQADKHFQELKAKEHDDSDNGRN